MSRFAMITEQHITLCEGNELVVLAALLLHDSGSGAWPSPATLSSLTKLSSRAVRKHLSSLEEKGLIREVGKEGRHRKWHIRAGTNVPTKRHARAGSPQEPEHTCHLNGTNVPTKRHERAAPIYSEQTREHTKEQTTPLPPTSAPGGAPIQPSKKKKRVTAHLEEICCAWDRFTEHDPQGFRRVGHLTKGLKDQLMELGAHRYTLDQVTEALDALRHVDAKMRKKCSLHTLVGLFSASKGKPKYIHRLMNEESWLVTRKRNQTPAKTADPGERLEMLMAEGLTYTEASRRLMMGDA